VRKTVAAIENGDVVSGLLRDFRVDSSVLCRSVMAAPWGFGVANRDVGCFHMVLGGSGWLEVDGVDEPVNVQTGDLVVIPKGNAHWVRDSPTTAAPSLTSILAHHEVIDGELHFGGDEGPLTEIVCGVFRSEDPGGPAWMTELPAVVRSPAQGNGDWRSSVAAALRNEARSPTPAGSAVVNRLLESLLADALRGELVRSTGGDGVPVEAVSDHRIGSVLARVHDSPEAPWTVERLARLAVMSRSAFSSRFRSVVGEAPMRYVTTLRLERARRLLRSTDLTVAEIAKRVGYASDSALSRALKTRTGEAPTDVRRARLTGADRS
jgi:AraC family transcriptional regulator, alkane utilization regulator